MVLQLYLCNQIDLQTCKGDSVCDESLCKEDREQILQLKTLKHSEGAEAITIN